MTLAELLRAANHDEWWNDDKQVYCEADGKLYPLTGICGGRPEKKGQGKDIVVLLTEERK